MSGCSLWGCRGVVEWVWSVGVVVGGVVCGRGGSRGRVTCVGVAIGGVVCGRGGSRGRGGL